jgi:hypothetical protein
MNNTINIDCDQLTIYHKDIYHIIQMTLKLSYRFLSRQVSLDDPDYESKLNNIQKKEEEVINKLYNITHTDKNS